MLAYLANLDKAEDKSVSLATFSSEVYPAFEMFFNTWISSRESKVGLLRLTSCCSHSIRLHSFPEIALVRLLLFLCDSALSCTPVGAH